ncbi:hypothetical protein QYF61_014310 [Mycteria americana]|uniref:Uncharacterized protein n=1 Tax=Mycteria americana TaxID=33587 RepID=A0AAN7NSN2_MYCAM|nr:hypothetical protein QYF61_014310 [Mycteria americana]
MSEKRFEDIAGGDQAVAMSAPTSSKWLHNHFCFRWMRGGGRTATSQPRTTAWLKACNSQCEANTSQQRAEKMGREWEQKSYEPSWDALRYEGKLLNPALQKHMIRDALAQGFVGLMSNSQDHKAVCPRAGSRRGHVENEPRKAENVEANHKGGARLEASQKALGGLCLLTSAEAPEPGELGTELIINLCRLPEAKFQRETERPNEHVAESMKEEERKRRAIQVHCLLRPAETQNPACCDRPTEKVAQPLLLLGCLPATTAHQGSVRGCELWQIQSPIGHKAEWQSNLWQRDRMNSWMFRLLEHKRQPPYPSAPDLSRNPRGRLGIKHQPNLIITSKVTALVTEASSSFTSKLPFDDKLRDRDGTVVV